MSLLPHIEDAFRAARHDAERDWPGDDTPTRAEAEADNWPMTTPLEDCGGCGRCLACAVRTSYDRATVRAEQLGTRMAQGIADDDGGDVA